MNYLNNQIYLSLVETLAKFAEDKEELDIRLRTELSLSGGACGVKSEANPNYLNALDQAINLLNECDNLEHFHQKLMSLK
jgi:hypothetical protein